VSNVPGLPAIAYRSGTHDSVLRRMVTALHGVLPRLGASTADDPAIGLLDGWATVADVVTFYQERIANEGFLRTATERRSVLELARAIGYELRPGVSATTYLDIRMQAPAAPGATDAIAPPAAAVPKGTRVLSIPAQGQLPQTFETAGDLTAAVGRNEMQPRQGRPQEIVAGRTRYYVAGADTGLRAGDAVLIAEAPADAQHLPPAWELRVLRSVVPQPAAAPDLPAATLITWDAGLENDYDEPVVYAFGLRAAMFGANAPDWRTMPLQVKRNYTANKDQINGSVWPGFALGDVKVIELDAAYPGVGPGSLLLLTQPGRTALYLVCVAGPDAQQNFAISSKTTRVTLDRSDNVKDFDRRQVTVLTQTRRLEPALEPIGKPTTGPRFDLLAPPPLTVGQQVIVTGTAAGKPRAEPARVIAVSPPGQPTTVVLDHELPAPFDLDSVRILGNVVSSSNGETVTEEILGSGDGTTPNQRFVLAKKGLTHLAAQVPGGAAAELEVRVDGVLWSQLPSLFPAGPHDRVYIVRIDDDAAATIIFGDGEHGARLPTGQENVRARYRFGIGPDGEVAAGSLTLLPQRPLGVAAADNPLPAGGATAPEVLADARRNAPLTVLTLDRVVSLRDYENYAQAFGGIAKARAVAIQGRAARFVHLTLAGSGGAEVHPDTIEMLRGALDVVRDRSVAVRPANRTLLQFRVRVAVLADPSRVAGDVRTAVGAALLGAFAVDQRDFAQPVTASEILAVAHQVPGVTAALVTELRLTEDDPLVIDPLVARDARLDPAASDPERVAPAELLLIDPGHVTMTEMTP
jgi:hypothetical protein